MSELQKRAVPWLHVAAYSRSRTSLSCRCTSRGNGTLPISSGSSSSSRSPGQPQPPRNETAAPLLASSSRVSRSGHRRASISSAWHSARSRSEQQLPVARPEEHGSAFRELMGAGTGCRRRGSWGVDDELQQVTGLGPVRERSRSHRNLNGALPQGYGGGGGGGGGGLQAEGRSPTSPPPHGSASSLCCQGRHPPPRIATCLLTAPNPNKTELAAEPQMAGPQRLGTPATLLSSAAATAAAAPLVAAGGSSPARAPLPPALPGNISPQQ